MYIRTITRKNKHGPPVTYVQVAHNQRDPETGQVQAQVLHSLGRLEDLDVGALKRMVKSISRFLSPEDALAACAGIQGSTEARKFLESRSMGSGFLLWAMWQRLGVHKALQALARERNFRADPAVAIFAMVANRALAASSKAAIPAWVAKDQWLPGVGELDEDQLYRAMDFLIGSGDELQKAVFTTTANLLNLRVDLLLYDTTSSYFEMEGDDRDLLDRQAAWEAFDKHRFSRPANGHFFVTA